VQTQPKERPTIESARARRHRRARRKTDSTKAPTEPKFVVCNSTDDMERIRGHIRYMEGQTEAPACRIFETELAIEDCEEPQRRQGRSMSISMIRLRVRNKKGRPRRRKTDSGRYLLSTSPAGVLTTPRIPPRGYPRQISPPPCLFCRFLLC
jgi:hypothetical protein